MKPQSAPAMRVVRVLVDEDRKYTVDQDRRNYFGASQGIATVTNGRANFNILQKSLRKVF